MYKNIVAIAAALAALSLTTLAQAGNGAPGTPAKHDYRASSHSSITEFSSSSARGGPHR